MEISDVLGTSWQNSDGIPADSEFRTVLEAWAEALTANGIETPYELLLSEVLIPSYSLERSHAETSNAWGDGDFLRTKSEDVENKSDYFSIEVRGEVSAEGLTLTQHPEETPIQLDDIQFIDYSEEWDAARETVIPIAAETERYSEGGLLQFIVDAIYWGLECWWNNPDTIGGSDRNFSVWRDPLNEERHQLEVIYYYAPATVPRPTPPTANDPIQSIGFDGWVSRGENETPDFLFTFKVGKKPISLYALTIKFVGALLEEVNLDNVEVKEGNPANIDYYYNENLPYAIVGLKTDAESNGYVPVGKPKNDRVGKIAGTFKANETFGVLLRGDYYAQSFTQYLDFGFAFSAKEGDEQLIGFDPTTIFGEDGFPTDPTDPNPSDPTDPMTPVNSTEAIISIECVGISSRDLVGSQTGEYKRDGSPDLLFLVTVGDKDITITEVTFTLGGDGPDEWNATTAVGQRPMSDDHPAVLVNVLQNDDGAYKPVGKKVNASDGHVETEAVAGEVFGIQINAELITQFELPIELNYVVLGTVNEDETEFESTGTITIDSSMVE